MARTGVRIHGHVLIYTTLVLWLQLENATCSLLGLQLHGKAGPGPSRCPEKCREFGTCNEELGRCDCPRHMNGSDCSMRLWHEPLVKRCTEQAFADKQECLNSAQNCLNGCNARGACVSGFCHCKPGHYGTDCSLSLGPDGRPALLRGQGYVPRAKGPRVYVYELPPDMTQWYNQKRLDRPTHLVFWQRLLSSGARTPDGDAADWYLIPVRQRGQDSALLVDAIAYIREHHPWWDRLGGARHFVIHTGDWGRWEASAEAKRLTTNMTWLTHWGLTSWRPVYRWEASHRVDKDVVIPVYIASGHFPKFGMLRSPLHPRVKARPRNATAFFFAGRLCLDGRLPPDDPAGQRDWPSCGREDDWYSGGIRIKVFRHHWNRTGYHVVRSEREYGTYLATSEFCLAPPGAGHGQRQIQALFMGCLPVTVADHILEPFEPAVSWDDWGVRVAEADIPRLHDILQGLGREEVARRQSRMRCAAQHMLWSSTTGGVFGEDGRYDAFETTLEVLRVMAAHPGVHPSRYREMDPDFAAFMDCREPASLGAWRREAEAARGRAPGRGEGPGEEGVEWDGHGAEDLEGSDGGQAEDDEMSEGGGEDEGGEEQDGQGEQGTGGGAGAAAAAAEAGAGAGGGSSPGMAPPAPLAGNFSVNPLCSHSNVDRKWRSCYHVLRGGGVMGVPGGAVCAVGYRHRLGTCPRLWP